MNRLLIAMVAAFGLTMGGCAADVDTPLPPPPGPQEEQGDPPNQLFKAALRDPQSLLIDGAELDKGFARVPREQVPPWVDPIPEKH